MRGPVIERRILILADIFGGVHGGTEGQVLTLASSLPEGWSAELWVLQDSTYLPTASFPIPWRAWHLPGYRHPAFGRGIRRIARAVAQGGFDLIHAFHADTCLLAPWIGRLANVPVLTSRRDLGYWQSPRMIDLLRRANRYASGIVANAMAVADRTVEVEHAHPQRMHVIYNGHAPERFEQQAGDAVREGFAIPQDAFVAGLVANVRPLKRQADLIEALAAMPSGEVESHVLLVGTGPDDELQALRDRAESLGVSDRVHMRGVTGDIVPWIRALDVGVLASRTEGLSNAIIEYMACGLPVLASAVGGNPELVEDGVSGALFQVGDVEALARHLTQLRDDPARRAAQGAAGRARYERLCHADRMLASMFSCYDNAIAHHAAPRFDPTWQVTRVDRVEALGELEADWEHWLDGRGFFLSPTWYRTWLAWADAAPCVITVRDAQGALMGLVPLVERKSGVLSFAGQDEGADHLDVVAPQARAEQVAACVLRHLAQVERKRLDLRHVRGDGALRAALHDPRHRLSWGERYATVCHGIDVEGSFDEYLTRTWSRKRRHELRRATKRLVEQDEVEIARVTSPDQVSGVLRRLFTLHARRFDVKGAKTAFDEGKVERLHQMLAPKLLHRGELLLLSLRRGGEDLAIYYAFRFKGRLSHFQSGIRADAGKGSPGTALRVVMLREDVFGAGLEAFDFLDGDEAYKRPWATHRHHLYDIHVAARGLRGRIGTRARGVLALVKSEVRRQRTSGDV